METILAALLALAGAPSALVGSTFSYRGSASGAESLSVNGEANWTPSSVEVLVRPLGGSAGSCGIVLHHQDDANHYLFLYSTNSSALMIYVKSGGAYTLLGSTPFSVPFGEQHSMRADDDGAGNLSLLWDDVLELSVSDSTFAAGRIGLRVWNMTTGFDDVLVEDAGGSILLSDDFEDGDDDGWTGGSAWRVVSGGGTPMPPPIFDASFEGGNVQVNFVDLASWTIDVTPELKGSSPYRAWFYFRMSNLSSAQPTNLVFQNASFFHRPAYSYDDVEWVEFPPSVGGVHSITFTQDPVWIAHSIPYVTRHEQQLLADVQGPLVQVSVLSTSEGGLPVHHLRITDPGGPAGKYGIWLVGRQHAWEASGSWIADGLVRWLASSDPQAVRLRRKAVVHVVPILDVDNVVLGGSGKDQQPIDINRDWRSEPHWNGVRDAIAAIEAAAAVGSYDVFIDSHCPGSATTFLAVQPQAMVSPAYWQRFQQFRQLLVNTAGSGALPYTGSIVEWGPAYHPLWNQMSFWHQFTTQPELRLSLTLETHTASLDGYRDLSRGLGRALDLFLPCPADASTYCTSGTSASGCRASLSGCGLPSATAPSGFDLIAGEVEGGKDGLFFLGTNGRQANPWGSGTSYQCVVPPVVRTSVLAGAGASGTCDGSFVLDLNSLWCPTCPKPAKNPGAGATVQSQLWYRDPQNTSNRTTSLSNAVELSVGP